MLLRPRKFIHKNRQKKRSLKICVKKYKLNYGQYGLRILQPLKLNNKQVLRYKIFLKKSVRRSDKTMRYLWFTAFPHLPLTRKISGSRMGKGKGKLVNWVSHIPTGLNMCELKNVRTGRAHYFLKQIQFRLPIKSALVSRNFSIKRVKLIFFKSYVVSEEVFL